MSKHISFLFQSVVSSHAILIKLCFWLCLDSLISGVWKDGGLGLSSLYDVFSDKMENTNARWDLVCL